MLPDVQKYLPYLEEFELTEEQKVELIHILWGYVLDHGLRAFGMNSVQQVLEARQLPDSSNAAV